jgi:hypothetical protein
LRLHVHFFMLPLSSHQRLTRPVFGASAAPAIGSLGPKNRSILNQSATRLRPYVFRTPPWPCSSGIPPLYYCTAHGWASRWPTKCKNSSRHFPRLLGLPMPTIDLFLNPHSGSCEPLSCHTLPCLLLLALLVSSSLFSNTAHSLTHSSHSTPSHTVTPHPSTGSGFRPGFPSLHHPTLSRRPPDTTQSSRPILAVLFLVALLAADMN